MHILEHITDLDEDAFTELEALDSYALMDGQARTAGLLEALGSPEHVLQEDQKQLARVAFSTVFDPHVDEQEKQRSLLSLRVPPAVRHLAGMLSEYDWEYVEQAKQLRGYIVAKLVEETKSPDARIRLQALKALGTVTEVGAFTERIEITKKDASADELAERIRAKLSALLPKVVEVETVTPKEDADGTDGS